MSTTTVPTTEVTLDPSLAAFIYERIAADIDTAAETITRASWSLDEREDHDDRLDALQDVIDARTAILGAIDSGTPVSRCLVDRFGWQAIAHARETVTDEAMDRNRGEHWADVRRIATATARLVAAVDWLEANGWPVPDKPV